MTSTGSKPLKAYMCRSDEETEIVFARTNGGAGFPFAASHGLDIGDVEVRRAPLHDRFAPGPVPVSALLDDGWHFECSHCYRRISLDDEFLGDAPPEAIARLAAAQAPHVAALARFDAASPRPEKPDDRATGPVAWAGRRRLEDWSRERYRLSMMVDPRPLTRDGLRIRDATGDVFCDAACEFGHHAARAAVDLAHADAVAEAERRWPGCAPYESGPWPLLEPNVRFSPPGVEHRAWWRPADGGAVHVAASDLDAWNAHLAACAVDAAAA